MNEEHNEIMQRLRPRAKTYNILIYQTGKCSIIVPDSESEKVIEGERERATRAKLSCYLDRSESVLRVCLGQKRFN